MASTFGKLAIVAVAVLALAAQIWWVYELMENVERLRGCSNSETGDGCSYAQLGYVFWAAVEIVFLAFWFGVYLVIRRLQQRSPSDAPSSNRTLARRERAQRGTDGRRRNRAAG